MQGGECRTGVSTGASGDSHQDKEKKLQKQIPTMPTTTKPTDLHDRPEQNPTPGHHHIQHILHYFQPHALKQNSGAPRKAVGLALPQLNAYNVSYHNRRYCLAQGTSADTSVNKKTHDSPDTCATATDDEKKRRPCDGESIAHFQKNMVSLVITATVSNSPHNEPTPKDLKSLKESSKEKHRRSLLRPSPRICMTDM